MSQAFQPGAEYAGDRDRNNPLQHFRHSFYIPDDGLIYLDGNSLGRLPLKARELIRDAMDHEWGTLLIGSWNKYWYDLPVRLGRKLAKIIGAGQDEVLVTEATSTNLFKLVTAALQHQKGRHRIISDDTNFPSDLYVLQGIAGKLMPGSSLEIVPSGDGLVPDVDAIIAGMDEQTALICLSHVCYKSSYKYDIEAITKAAHQHGCLVLWDLSHSAGAVPVELKRYGVDLAVGCTYKYLNGGPGSPAYLFVRKDLQDRLINPVWGWFSADDPFDFKMQYEPAENINRFQVGTPPVLSMRAIEPGLDLVLEAGVDAIRQQSIHLTEYLRLLVMDRLAELGVSLASPEDPDFRGSHLALQYHEAYRVSQAMIQGNEHGVRIIPDFRDPDIIRLGVSPLYNTYHELFLSVERIREIILKKEFEHISSRRNAVT